jgi:hypothetical protein
MSRILVLALLLATAGCGSDTDTPKNLADGWCQRHRPDDAACLKTADQDNTACMTGPTGTGGYDACRAARLDAAKPATP